jgi:8-amino-7-oxononanoate synthase
MSDPLQRFRDAAALRAFNGVVRRLRARPAGGDGLVDLASNDYLGMAHDPRVVSAAATAALAWGAGSTGSRLVTGSTALHAELEMELAAFLSAPAALVFSSGYLANLATISTLGGQGVLVVSDQSNHASIVDACRLSRSRLVVTPHRDTDAVERALALREEEHAIVVTDAVFSVDGDLAPLPALHAVARRHSALLVVDEAHSLGVVGEGGRGAIDAIGLGREPDVIRTLTLSKSLGAQGGAVVGPGEVIETLVDTGRPFIFDTGLAPSSAGAALAALRILAASPALALQVRAKANELAWLVRQSGLSAGRPDAAVLAVTLGDPHTALHAQQVCADHGVRVGCFRPPAVPNDRSCLRLTARANLTEAHLSMAARALHAVARSRGVPSLP